MDRELLGIIVSAIALVVLTVVGICLPIAYCDGSAKAAYIKQTQGIDIAWYHATWLEVNAAGVAIQEKK